MHILQLCYKPPYPPVDGGTLAMNSVTQGLFENGQQVKVLAVCSDKHPVHPDALEPELMECIDVLVPAVELN